MKKKRSKFWTVVFSFLPGAGHMFMGFMKLGVSMMGLFFLIIFLSSFLNIGPLMYLLPILWFYSFFDCINRAYASDEEFAAMEDRYLFSADTFLTADRKLSQKGGTILGVSLVVVGGYMMLKMLFGYLHYGLPDQIYFALQNVLSSVPQVVFSLLIIALGVYLIVGKKKEMDRNG